MSTCFECGSTDNLHEHHVVPQGRGGTATVPLCHKCHALAHGHPSPGDWDIATLTSEALQHKKANGEYTGGGIPYGYTLDADGSTLLEDPAEQTVIEAVLEHREAGLSLRKVADRLEADGFTTRKGGKLLREANQHTSRRRTSTSVRSTNRMQSAKTNRP
ncbi:MAG: hypothetical protein U5L04_01485 [Trueperaceae bacterium]|nr:hypothetical protein [Trueperaceae bacterium]